MKIRLTSRVMKAGFKKEEGHAPIYDEGMHPGVFVVPLVLMVLGALLLLAMSILVGFFLAALQGVGGGDNGSTAGPNRLLLIASIPLGIVVTAAFVIVGIGYRTTRVRLTPNRLRLKIGFVSRSEAEIGIPDIESVLLRRPPLGRLLGYGTVVVKERGGTSFELSFLPHPERLHRSLLDLRRVKGRTALTHSPPEEPRDDTK